MFRPGIFIRGYYWFRGCRGCWRAGVAGTESLLRVMVEGQDDKVVQEIAEDLVSVVKSCIH